MRIDQLPPGARFHWKGAVYTKVGPMTASAECGSVVFIPKHAVLRLVEEDGPRERAVSEKLDRAEVMSALEIYHRTAMGLVDEPGRRVLERAWRELHSTLV